MTISGKARIPSWAALAVALCFTTICLAQSQEAPEPLSDQYVTDDQLLIAAALTEKILADEFYLKAQAEYCMPVEEQIECTGQDADPVRKAYCSVKNRLGTTNINYSDGRDIIRELLIKDSSYRLRLRRHCLPFWGGITTRTPGIPNVFLQEMGDLLALLEVLAEEIRVSQQITAGLYAQAARDQASVANAHTRRGISNVHERRSRFSQQTAMRARDRMLNRVEQLDEVRTTLSKEVSDLIERQEKAGAAVQSALLDGVGQALGLPPGFHRVLESGSLDQAAISMASSMLLAEDSEVAKSFNGFLGEYQDDVRQLAEAFKTAEGAVARIELGREALESAADAFRKGQFDRLLKSGVLLYEQADEFLPDDYDLERWQGELRDVIEKSKPAQGLLGIAEFVRTKADEAGLPQLVKEALDEYQRLPDEIKGPLIKVIRGHDVEKVIGATLQASIQNALSEQLAQLGVSGGGFRPVIWKRVEKIYQSLGRAYSTMFNDSNMGARERRIVLNAIFRAYPEVVVDLIESWVRKGDPQTRSATERALNILGFRNTSAFAKAVSETGLHGLIGLYVRQNRNDGIVKLEVGALDPATDERLELFVTSVPDVVKHVTASKFGVLQTSEDYQQIAELGESFLKTFDTTVQLLEGRTDSYIDGLLSEFNASEVAGLARTMAKEGQLEARALWHGIVDKVESNVRSRILDALSGVAASQRVVESASLQSANGHSISQAPVSENSDDGNVLAQKMVSVALDAAFPGAGTAFNIAISVLTGLAEVVDLGNQLSRSVAEIKETYARQVHLMELATQANNQIELAKFEEEIADLAAKGAAQEFAKLNEALEVARDQEQQQLRQIERRKPLVYYLLERLRESYDALDRSLALWLGELDRPSGLIAAMIQNDPALIRLAVDSDIHLYDWLNHEEGQQSRADLEASLAYWRQLYQLAKDICRRQGCLPGNARLGETSQTRMVGLVDLLTDRDLKRLRAWQDERASSTLQLPFLVGADWGEVRIDVDNMRVIDVRLGLMVDGTVMVTPHTTLIHPGTAFILREGHPETESLVPVVTSGFDSPAEPFHMTSLRNRWNITPSRLPLEGYGLMTEWILELSPSEESYGAEDIMIRFAFHYNEPRNLVDDYDYLLYLDFPEDKIPEKALAFTRRQMLALGRPNDLQGRFERITKGSKATIKPMVPKVKLEMAIRTDDDLEAFSQ